MSDSNREAQLITLIQDRMDRAMRYMSRYQTTWDAAWKAWYGYVDHGDKKKWPWRSHVHVPMTNTIVWTATAAQIPALIGGDQFIQYVPKHPLAVERAAAGTNFVNHELKTDIPYTATMVEALMTKAIFGTAILKVVWRRDPMYKVKRWRRRTVLGLGNGEGGMFDEGGKRDLGYEQYDETIRGYDNPELSIARLRDTFVEPGSTGFDGPGATPWVIERRVESYAQIMAKQKANPEWPWRNMAELRNVEPLNRQQSNDSAQDITQGAEPEYDEDRTSPSRKYQTVTMWDKDTKKVTYAVSSGKTDNQTADAIRLILYQVDNPYDHGHLPFIRLVNMLVPGSFYGIGWPELVSGLQAALDTTLNQQIDAVTRAMLAPLICDAADEAEHGVKWRLGMEARWPADRPEAMHRLEMARIPPEHRQTFNLVLELMQLVSGVVNTRLGQGEKNVDTATGMKLLQNATDQRFGLHVMLDNDLAVTRLGMLLLGLFNQFVDGKRYIALGGEDPSELSPIGPSQLAGNWEVGIEPMGSADNIDRASKLARIMQFVQMVAQFPNAPLNMDAIIQEIARESGFKNTSRFLIPKADRGKPEVPPEVTQQQVEGEHEALAQSGQMPPPAPGQDHQQHILFHYNYQNGTEYNEAPDEMKWSLVNHIASTYGLMQQEAAMEQAPPAGGEAPTAAGGEAPRNRPPMPGNPEESAVRAQGQQGVPV